jgi:trigger factor
MTITREDLNPCTVQLAILTDEAEMKEALTRAAKVLAKQVKIPGFRPGTAPLSVVEQAVGTQVFNQEAADQLVRGTLRKAIEQQQVASDPTTPPSVELKSFDRAAQTAEYIAKVPLPPQVELGDYMAIPVEVPEVQVSDAEVDYQVEELRKSRAKRENVTDRGVEEGDVVVVNLVPEGVESKTFMVTAGQSFEQLDQALLGMAVEEIKSVDLTFPADFQEATWAGQTFKTTLTVNSLNAVKTPELDDAFAANLQLSGVEELKTRVRESLMRAKDAVHTELVTDKLLAEVLARSTVHVSDNMWENLAERRLNETAREQAKQGRSLEEYAKSQGMTLDEFVQTWNDRARNEVRRALIIQQIFSKEEMKLTNDDLSAELYEMAREYGIDVKEMLELLQKNKAMDELQFRSIQRRVRNFLLSHADRRPVAALQK